MMMCDVCKCMITKDVYSACHDYMYTSGNDLEGGPEREAAGVLRHV
jgi:hypothetical protein